MPHDTLDALAWYDYDAPQIHERLIVRRVKEVSGVAMEAGEIGRAGATLPSAESLVALARLRLRGELSALPPPDSSAWRAALLSDVSPGAPYGALAHAIRRAAGAGRMAEAQAIFVALLKRIDGLNRRWIASALVSLPISVDERRELEKDLAQELTTLLWQQIGLRDDEAWELFFQRALAFAQSHVATSYLRRQGLRVDPRVRQAERGLAAVFSRLADDADAEGAIPITADAPDFARSELSDLRDLVARLPERERLTVVMRFWQQADESEIAEALGGVTTRAVRYILRRAYGRLRAWYAGERDDMAADEEVTDGRSR